MVNARALGMLTLTVLFASACGEEVAPASYVDKLRILGISAKPADLAPGETTVMNALVVDPSRPGKKNTLLWLACDPDPTDLTRSACSDTTTLQDPSSFAPSGQLPPGVNVIGLGPVAAYTASKSLFDALDPNDPKRINGAVAQVLLVAVAAELPPNATKEDQQALFAKVKSKEIASVIGLFRLRISEDPQRNALPTLSELDANDIQVPEGGTLWLFPNKRTKLELKSPASDFEQYDQLSPSGVDHKTEKILAALYSTTGRFEQERLEIGSGTPESFQQPKGASNDPIPADGEGELWIVLRDTRGGQSFYDFPFIFCDASLPAPFVSTFAPGGGPADGTQLVTLTGTNLTSILDVSIGGKALQNAQYDAVSNRYTGNVPALPPGTYPVLVRGRHCADVQTAFSYQTP